MLLQTFAVPAAVCSIPLYGPARPWRQVVRRQLTVLQTQAMPTMAPVQTPETKTESLARALPPRAQEGSEPVQPKAAAHSAWASEIDQSRAVDYALQSSNRPLQRTPPGTCLAPATRACEAARTEDRH